MTLDAARQRIESAIAQYGQHAAMAIELVINEVRSDMGRDAVNELIDEFDLDTTTLGAAIDAAQTIPFLTDRRIVVARRFGRFEERECGAGRSRMICGPRATGRS